MLGVPSHADGTRWYASAARAASMSHLRTELDPIIHSPPRFSIMATLAAGDKVEFGFVRDTVELSDSALSQHVAKLETAGYVTVAKGRVGRRARTWLAATKAGREAFERHVALLNRIADGPAQRDPAAQA